MQGKNDKEILLGYNRLMERQIDIPEEAPKKIMKPREIATVDAQNREQTMRMVRNYFKWNEWLYQHFRAVAVYPDAKNALGFTVITQYATKIQLQIPPSEWLMEKWGFVPAKIVIQSVENENYGKKLWLMKVIPIDELEEYMKLYAHLDNMRGIASAKGKTLNFIPRTLSIVDNDGTQYANLMQIPLKIPDIMDVLESFFYVASSKNPLPRKFQWEKI